MCKNISEMWPWVNGMMQVLSAATLIAKHTSSLCNTCRTASSKTANPVAKRHFVQSAKDVANSTANLVRAIKVIDVLLIFFFRWPVFQVCRFMSRICIKSEKIVSVITVMTVMTVVTFSSCLAGVSRGCATSTRRTIWDWCSGIVTGCIPYQQCCSIEGSWCGLNVIFVAIMELIASETLKWDVHITAMLYKASKRIHFLKQLRRVGVSTADLLTYCNSVIRSVLEYASR